MANDFVSQILFLSKEKKPVDIFLSSPGGSVNAGLVIYDLVQSCRFPVNIYCTGKLMATKGIPSTKIGLFCVDGDTRV